MNNVSGMGDVVMMSGSRWGPILIKGMVLLLILSARTMAQYSGGSGTAQDPYQISSTEDLLLAGKTSNDYKKHFLLVGDIDLTGQIFSRAILAPDMRDAVDSFQGAPFTGHFNGQGHVIYGLCIQGKDYLGLFGNLGSGAKVTNLGLVSVSIEGYDCVGALAGFSYLGHIDSSYSTGTIRAGNRTGGLVGWNLHGAISSCVSLCSVQGGSSVGGLAGVNGGRVLNTYSAGPIRGADGIGGLIGDNQSGRIGTSFSFGTVQGEDHSGGLIGKNTNGRIVDSFWDVRASGLAQSDGGIGLTTAVMYDPNTTLDVGWNLLGHSAKGMLDFWQWARANQPALAPVPPPVNLHVLDSLWKSPVTHTCLGSSLNLLGVSWKVMVAPGWAGGFGMFGTCLESISSSGTGDILVASVAAAGPQNNAGSLGPQSVAQPVARAGEPSRVDSDSVSRNRPSVDRHFPRDPTAVPIGSDAPSFCMESIGERGGRQAQIPYALSKKSGYVLPAGAPTGRGLDYRNSLVALDHIDALAADSWMTQSSILTDVRGNTRLMPMEMEADRNHLGPDWEFLDTFKNDYPRSLSMGDIEGLSPKPYSHALMADFDIPKP